MGQWLGVAELVDLIAGYEICLPAVSGWLVVAGRVYSVAAAGQFDHTVQY